jgi:hypothetical protein
MFRHDDGETLGLYPTIDQSGGAEISKSALWKQHGTGGGIVRLLQPQKYLDLLWNFQSSLEFEFGSRVGCHAELMPPSSVGYGKVLMDTTDSIVLQLEGVSRWKLFQPRKKQALKAQSTFVSSGAVSEDEALELSMPVDSFVTATVEEEPYSEVKLSPGDTLYVLCSMFFLLFLFMMASLSLLSIYCCLFAFSDTNMTSNHHTPPPQSINQSPQYSTLLITLQVHPARMGLFVFKG